MPSAKRSKPGPDSTIRVVAGTDTDAVRRNGKELSIQMLPEGGDEFSIQVIDGAAETVDAATASIYETKNALLTLPFFGSKLVWLKGATFLQDSVVGKSESVLSALESLLETLQKGLPGGVRFLVSAISPDKRRSFYKKLGAIATIEQFDRIDTGKTGWEADVASVVRSRARDLGLDFRPEALDLFVLFVGADSGQAGSDLEKLDLFLGEERRTVETSDVMLLVPESHTGTIWQISNAILARRLDEAIEAMEKFLNRGESAVGLLLAAILPTVRGLVYTKALLEAHSIRPPRYARDFIAILDRLPGEETSHLPRKQTGEIKAWQLGNCACAAGEYTLPELRKALTACLEANHQLVTSQFTPQLVLTRLLVKIVGKQPEK